MKIVLALLFAFVACIPHAFSQYFLPLKWTDNPKVHEIPAVYAKESAVFILDRRNIEFRAEGPSYYVFRTIHRIIKVLDEKGIESFNKVNIPAGADREITTIKARTILPDGRVFYVGPDKIKKSKNENGVPEYSFAMEAMEKNAEVEIFYIEKKDISVFGSETFQYRIPVMKADFTLICPDMLEFETKGYNGFPQTTDTMLDLKIFYHAEKENIPGLEEEPYSNFEANLMQMDFRLNKIKKEKPYKRLYTWDDLAKQIYKDFYTLSDRQKRTIRTYLEDIGWKASDNELTKIKIIEEAIKSGITMRNEFRDESYYKFEKIIEKKVTNESAYARFFAACLLVAGVDHQLGITTDRFSNVLDEKFENWLLLENYIFYLPNQKKYLAPNAIFSRMPFIPLGAVNNKGIFCKITTDEDDEITAKALVRTIPVLPPDSSFHNIDASIRFNEDMVPEVDITHSMKGYNAVGSRELFVYTTKDKEKELVQNIVSIAPATQDIETYKVQNTAFKNYFNNAPLLVQARVKAPQLMEKAGSKYLFNLGDVIGRQSEMYEEKIRKMPIDIRFPHSQVRNITLNIPPGYRVTNPESIKIFMEHKDSARNATMGFKSDYKMDGATLKISITEFYYQLHYPVSDIEIFRKVINAAADFNKVVLVLEKM